MQKLVLIGGSNAYWEVNELLKDINSLKPRYEIVGILDDNPALIGTQCNDLIIDGPIDKAKNIYQDDVKFVFAIGSYKSRIDRHEILCRLAIPEERFETLIHPTAKIFSTSIIRHGCIVHYGTVVFNHSIIDSFSIISANCVIASENYLGRGVLMGSCVVTTKGVKIGSFSHIGSSASIAEGIEIEPGAQVGMGSLVLRRIKAGYFALGNPCRMIEDLIVPQTIIDDWNASKLINKLLI